MSEWHPIETAPQTGEPIILAVDDGKHWPRSGWWSQSFNCWVVRENVDRGECTAIRWPLTHWMRLPAPPSKIVSPAQTSHTKEKGLG